MRDLSRVPLAELRRRVHAARGTRRLAALRSALEGDARAGARSLAEEIEKQLASDRAERRRLSRLFALRRRLVRDGTRCVAGVDEVGVGPLAGPVVAAAVVLPDRCALPGLDDSKRVSAKDRARLDAVIRQQATAFAIAEVWNADIERLNIYWAALEAMRRCVAGLTVRPDHVLVDARTIPQLGIPQTSIVQGDARDGSIAAASILAKVHRDELMRRMDERHPGYGFARHKGYGTAEHLEALRRLGPCRIHRRGFAPVAQLSIPGLR